MEKVSRKAFMDSMDGKRVTLVSTSCVTQEELEQAIKALEHDNIYHTVANAPFKDKYTGVFHKCSHGFYRLMADGTKSYKEFSNGDYILSDGKLVFIITPTTMRVCVYRVEN